MSVFFFLCFELGIVAILVLPLPRKLRNLIARKIADFRLGDRIRFAAQWIMFGLIAALVESITTLQRLEGREHQPASSGHSPYDPSILEVSIDKQRKFRAERNLYLAGFSLTLLFVIARVTELMQECVKFEDERDSVKKRLDDITSMANSETIIGSENSTTSTLRERKTAGAKEN